ncbi:MAG: cytochrome C oxidase subunit IV family protein [Sulfuricella sp.]|nr:cytochrome C oxidase subunit IV family protein [Sulfuricella sp.]
MTGPRNDVLVWLALLALLLLTLGSAYVPLGRFNTTLHLAIAATQAALVLLFSMHLRTAHPLLRAVAAVGFFGIAILIALSLADVMTR